MNLTFLPFICLILSIVAAMESLPRHLQDHLAASIIEGAKRRSQEQIFQHKIFRVDGGQQFADIYESFKGDAGLIDGNGNNMLNAALIVLKHEHVRFVLNEFGANVLGPNDDGDTTLILALRFLIRHADINIQPISCLEKIIDASSTEILATPDRWGNTPLHFLIRILCDTETFHLQFTHEAFRAITMMVSRLIERGCDYRALDSNGNSPLYYASTVPYLLERWLKGIAPFEHTKMMEEVSRNPTAFFPQFPPEITVNHIVPNMQPPSTQQLMDRFPEIDQEAEQDLARVDQALTALNTRPVKRRLQFD